MNTEKKQWIAPQATEIEVNFHYKGINNGNEASVYAGS